MEQDLAGTITALVAQKRNKTRVNVHIDGEYAFSLAAVHAAGLHKGQHLKAEDRRRLEHADAVEVAYERALNLLSYRARSEWEVRQRLEKALQENATPEVVDGVVERLERVGLLDDEAFAQAWVRSRQESGPRGKRALRYELIKKGVAYETIEAALVSLDEDDAALRAGQAWATRLRGLDKQTFTRRLGGFLSRRGFDYDVSRGVVDQLWEDVGNEHAHDPGES